MADSGGIPTSEGCSSFSLQYRAESESYDAHLQTLPVSHEVRLLLRIARALERIADRFDSDAKEFNEMVQKGKNLSA
jgi:phosphate uptake regulator